MTAERAKIAIGDFCRYDGKFCELVAIDGVVAKLRREDGQLAAVKIADLFADRSFDVFSPSVRRRPIPPDYFSTRPTQVRERVLWREHHISEPYLRSGLTRGFEWKDRAVGLEGQQI